MPYILLTKDFRFYRGRYTNESRRSKDFIRALSQEQVEFALEDEKCCELFTRFAAGEFSVGVLLRASTYQLRTAILD
jgi:hypothetical protein